jgi:hypothetical protein
MLYATGLGEADMGKPQVGISSVWYEGNPCNMHLGDLAAEVKAGVEAAGMVGYRFNTIGVSDGISMGTDGMSFSLQSRDLIADSIETVMGAQWYDANVSLPGCDKNMPGTIMAAARLNRPSLMVYGGTIRAGRSAGGEPLDIVSAFQSYGASGAGERRGVEGEGGERVRAGHPPLSLAPSLPPVFFFPIFLAPHCQTAGVQPPCERWWLGCVGAPAWAVSWVGQRAGGRGPTPRGASLSCPRLPARPARARPR